MTPDEIKKEFKAIREKQRRLIGEYRNLESRIDFLEKITQENNGGVEASTNRIKLHLYKQNLRTGKAKLLDALNLKN